MQKRVGRKGSAAKAKKKGRRITDLAVRQARGGAAIKGGIVHKLEH